MKSERLHILLVEDEEFDFFVTQHYLKKLALKYDLHHAHSGAEALDYLRQKSARKNAALPDLILMDVGLPDMDGRDVVKTIETNPRWAKIPTIILTGQNIDPKTLAPLHMMEHTYMNKWVDMDEFFALIQAVGDVKRDDTDDANTKQ